jgi:hypothetical protein
LSDLAELNERKNEELQTLLEERTRSLKAAEMAFSRMAELSPAGM